MGEDSREMASQLSNFVNSFDCDIDGCVDAILEQHRTLQQSIFRLFLKTINKWSKLDESLYDLRNECTVETSKKIMKALQGTDGVPFI